MVFVKKVTCNFFAFVVVIKNTDNAVRKKSNLSNGFSCFPIIVVFAKLNFCRFAFNKVNLLFVQMAKLQKVLNKFIHFTKLKIVGCWAFVIWQKVSICAVLTLPVTLKYTKLLTTNAENRLFCSLHNKKSPEGDCRCY